MPAPSTEATDRRPTRSRYQKLQPRWSGLGKDEIADDQRRRLYEAMVEVATSRGYPATTITAVWATAGVSSHTYYALFPKSEGDPKQACFLGAYDYVVARAAQRINLAYLGEEDPERRLCRAFEQFASEAAGEPQAARFALLEPFGAGQAAFARMDRGREMFEGLIAASISNPSRGATLSPTIAKGIVGGVERVSRVYLLGGRIDELAATANELSAWVSSYRPWSRSTPAEIPEAATRLQAGLSSKDERLRILRAAAAIAASDGYSGLSVARITRLAEVSEKTFASLYNSAMRLRRAFWRPSIFLVWKRWCARPTPRVTRRAGPMPCAVGSRRFWITWLRIRSWAPWRLSRSSRSDPRRSSAALCCCRGSETSSSMAYPSLTARPS
jgi:AcrR family transcriptional regulator